MQEQPQFNPQPAYPVIIQPKNFSFNPTQVEW